MMEEEVNLGRKLSMMRLLSTAEIQLWELNKPVAPVSLP
jgi:hypothetical protein